MSFYKILGQRTLDGSVRVHGAKNSVLPILAATLLAADECVIHNCPNLSDVSATLEILEYLGCKVKREDDTIWVDSSSLTRYQIPDEMMQKMRSSVIFLGALLARGGIANLSYPGGCMLGPRPIDMHLSALKKMGAEILEDGQGISCHNKGMCGCEICLPLPSVGATENIMLAACGCKATTTIVGAAREPEIYDLQQFLCAMGAKVGGAGTSVITIEGMHPLHGAQHTVISDRIVAATYLCAAASAGGEVELTDVCVSHLTAVMSALWEGGAKIRTKGNRVFIKVNRPIGAIRAVHTAPYPGFPTDAQPVLMAALSGATGNTMFVENMFESRYSHVDELCRMGADIRVSGRVAVINGVSKLHGAKLRGCDLRGAAALVVAALGAAGESHVYGTEYIARGYENLQRDLKSLGAEITLGKSI